MSSPLSSRQFAEQLPMFMTADEIMNHYNVWQRDKEMVGEEGLSYGELIRKMSNEPDRTHLPSNEELDARMGNRHEETDQEMMDRKYREASKPRMIDGEYSKGIPKTSLVEEIRENGALEKPIHLTPGTWWRGPEGPGEVLGDAYFKGDIVGGHHRLAVHQKDRPDDLLPVMFHKNIRAAKESGHYA